MIDPVCNNDILIKTIDILSKATAEDKAVVHDYLYSLNQTTPLCIAIFYIEEFNIENKYKNQIFKEFYDIINKLIRNNDTLFQLKENIIIAFLLNVDKIKSIYIADRIKGVIDNCTFSNQCFKMQYKIIEYFGMG